MHTRKACDTRFDASRVRRRVMSWSLLSECGTLTLHVHSVSHMQWHCIDVRVTEKKIHVHNRTTLRTF